MGNTVAIIGHGSSLQGKRRGEEIDFHDIVIRMANCEWQDATDYGKKYTIGVYAYGSSFTLMRRSSRRPHQYWHYITRGDPSAFWVEKGVLGFPKEGLSIPVLHLGGCVWSWVRGDKKFSRGTAAAIACMELIKPVKISLYGFDDVKRGRQIESKVNYGPLRKYLLENKAHTRRNVNDHNWFNEGEILRETSRHFGIEVEIF